MKVFVAGATGVLGRPLVPQLVAQGHEVVGMTRSASKQDVVRILGARPVLADALDPDAVAQAVASAEPEVIVHQLTALSGPMSAREARHLERSVAFTMTNRPRTEGTDHLLAAGRAVGARFMAQSFGAWRWARTGGPVQTEADPLDPDPPAPLRTVQAGYLYLERAVTTIGWGEGVVLRYGGFYGPGTAISLAPDAVMAAPIRKRRFPIVGDGGGVHSHVHVEDAAAATVAAVDHGRPGMYNVVDDNPAPVREWLPVLASALGAKPPRRVPRWLERLAGGEVATIMMTDVLVPQTRRRSESSVGSRAVRAGGRASRRDWTEAMTAEELDALGWPGTRQRFRRISAGQAPCLIGMTSTLHGRRGNGGAAAAGRRSVGWRRHSAQPGSPDRAAAPIARPETPRAPAPER